MADVIGPNSYLPGNIMHRDIPEGTMCDTHGDRLAIAEIVGETDSMGSETYYCCKECLDEDRNAPPELCTCDWCKAPNVETRPMRDYEEGTCGRVYEVCQSCRDRYNKRAREEADADDLYYGRSYDYLEPEPYDDEE
jgi:hypothetical protein